MHRPKPTNSRAARLEWPMDYYVHLGVSNRDLSFQCGLKETHLGTLQKALVEKEGAWEVGTLDKISRTTGTDPAWLLDGRGPLPTPAPLRPTTPQERGDRKKLRESGANLRIVRSPDSPRRRA